MLEDDERSECTTLWLYWIVYAISCLLELVVLVAVRDEGCNWVIGAFSIALCGLGAYAGFIMGESLNINWRTGFGYGWCNPASRVHLFSPPHLLAVFTLSALVNHIYVIALHYILWILVIVVSCCPVVFYIAGLLIGYLYNFVKPTE
jgi:hypothetical protein